MQSISNLACPRFLLLQISTTMWIDKVFAHKRGTSRQTSHGEFDESAEDNRADLSGIRDQKIPSQKAESIKDKKAQNWFPRQFLRKMSHEYDSLDIERATAIAAAAFAICSQYSSEHKIDEGPESSLTRAKSKVGSFSRRLSDGLFGKVPIFPVTDDKKPERTLIPVSSLKKTSSGQLNRDDAKPEIPPARKSLSFGDANLKKTDEIKPAIPELEIAPPVKSRSSRRMPPPPPPPPQPAQVGDTSIKTGPPRPRTPPKRLNTANERKAAAWEKEQLEKIKQRYDKLKETIDSWENKKAAKARRKLEKKERSGSDRERQKGYARFQSDMEYINGIARGASAEAEQRRRNEELKVREKVNAIRLTGKLPGSCPCF